MERAAWCVPVRFATIAPPATDMAASDSPATSTMPKATHLLTLGIRSSSMVLHSSGKTPGRPSWFDGARAQAGWMRRRSKAVVSPPRALATRTRTCSNRRPMECNVANLFEIAVDAYPEREYLVANGKRRTYAEMEARANQLAHHLAAQGIGPGDHVGIYAYNSVEWVETLWAVFKLRAVWINVNYRYVKDELHYLLTNADLKVLVHQREFSPLVGSLLPDLADLRHIIVIEDGTDVPYPSSDAVGYEDALAGQSTARDFGPRSADDLYILYTGGTTGMPKGVV